MRRSGKYIRSLAMISAGAILCAPLTSCSSGGRDKVARPPVASTDENGNVISGNQWGDRPSDDDTEAAKTFRDYDKGLFIGASDLLNAYYAFDDPKNYYSDWPTVGLLFPQSTDYSSAASTYEMLEDTLSSLDPAELSDAQNRAIKDMCFDFKYMSEMYKHYLYIPQLNPMGGKHVVYPLLASLIPFETKDDVDRYFTIIGDFKDFFTRAFEAEELRSSIGIGYNDESIDRIIQDCFKMKKDHDTNFMKTTFDERVKKLGLSDRETEELINKNQELLDLYYFPAMEMLIEKLPELKGKCNDAPYLAETADGKAYYEALFARKTGTDMPVEEAKELLQKRIDEIYEEYMPQWKVKGSYFAFGDLEFDEASEWCKRFTEEHFPAISDHDVEVYPVPRQLYDSIQPARYYPSPIDNYTRHTVWINNALLDDPQYDMFTLVSHEMYPGHLYQHQYQAENLESKYQVFAMSEPYAEGWAQYSETIMIQYAPFDRKQAKLSVMASIFFSTYIAARLSIGVEYEGWDYEDCKTYIMHYGQDGSVIDEYWKRLTAEQGYALEYAFGFLFTSEILDQAIADLDGICTPEEVYKAYLDLGCAPFSVLKEDMAAFVESKKN
ncbi:MAG: DUF885 family protein [Saccharofermentanaceae bacterium]|nr:DUF885 family protein [Saccharofermentanaceae bacterium]